MFGQILFTQWKSGKVGIGMLAVVAFGLPLMAIQDFVVPEHLLGERGLTADILFNAWQAWIPLFPALAALSGILVALNAWNWDHKIGHVYALSLPLSRRNYAVLKAAAGATLLMIPVAALGVSSLLAVWATEIPTGLQAYPLLFVGRFLLASLLMFSVFFAMASGTTRTVGLILGGIVVAVVGAQMASIYLGHFIPGTQTNPITWFVGLLVKWPGPFNVFFGNWMLIDV
jgi:hypothetical protein